MVKWQRRARVSVGLFGVVCAVVVYAAIGERQTAAPVERPSRLDPRAIIESAGAALQQFQQARKDFVVKADRQMFYEDGSSKYVGVTIEVRNRGGRDFVVSGREAQAREDNTQLEVKGAVKLVASDGFTVMAEEATFNEADATLSIPGAVTFSKGRMTGSGAGMTYHQTTDVLSLAEAAHVTVAGDEGQTVTEFTSATATLARLEKYLALEGSVHVLRDGQVLQAERTVARLSEDEEHITFIELRDNARVSGGRLFESMRAREIDLDYSDDGTVLERVMLRGSGAIAMRGDGEGASGRDFAGDRLELTFAPDATLTAAIGQGNVRIDLPSSGGTPARTVTAQAFEAAGEPGKGLTSARFTDRVEYREQTAGRQPARLARSATLQIGLADDAVTDALFTGGVRFEEGALSASGARAEYDPAAGTLRVSGMDDGRSPRVADTQVQIEAASIAITLSGPRMVATGDVKTILQPRPAAAGSPAKADEARLPGLLQQGTAVNVNADALDYAGGAGKAIYSGNATLWQGETAIRADLLTLDRTRGDLTASGAARSNIVFDTGVSIGRAPEIRYEDAARLITYGPAGRGAASTTPGPIAPTAVTAIAQLSGPQGDLRGRRIEVVLAQGVSRVERLEAYTDVNVRLDTRTATGDRLTYHAADERYVITGIPTVPVRIVEECRETIGRTVTFFKATDRIVVDGNEEVRTRSSRGGPCPPAAR